MKKMKAIQKFIWAILAALLLPMAAFADDTCWNAPLPMGNNKSLCSRSAATQNDLPLVTMNSSGDLILNVPVSGRSALIQSTGTTFLTLTSTGGISSALDYIVTAAAKGFVAGEAARAANVTTATTLAVPLYISAAGSGTDLAAFVGSGASATGGATVDFFKTRATSGAATTIVVSGDVLGTLKFFGANGTTYDPAAAIIVTSDATPGASADMPGAIDFQLSPDGSATLASALKLNNAKKATFGGIILSNAAAGAGDVAFTNSGNTLSIQEATAGAACSGTVTANAATPVVTSTTCWTTGSRVFLTKTSTSAVNGSCYISSTSNGVSFTITCLATDTGTYNWVIFHEAP